LLLAAFFAVWTGRVSAAGPDTLWIRAYGGASSEYCYSAQQTYPDSGYIIVGSTFSFGEGSYDVYIVKTDRNGDGLWIKTFGQTGTDHGRSVQQTLDGGYIIAGYTNSSGAGGDDILLIKTDEEGDTVWAYTYGGPSDDRGYSVQQVLPDSGYVVAGYTDSFGGGSRAAYLVRTGPTGSFLWARTYGGADWDEARCVSQTFPDSGYIIVGATASSGAGEDDVYLIKTDPSGYVDWEKTFGGPGDDYGYAVRQTLPDSGYVITGNTKSFGAGGSDIFAVKTDASGDTVWTRTFGGPDIDYGYSVQQTDPDNGYVIAGATRSFGTGNYDAYVVKTDQYGEAVWTNTYGGTEYDDAYLVRQIPADSAYIIVGSTHSFGTGLYDAFIAKTEPVKSGLRGVEPWQSPLVLRIIPNPSKDRISVQYQLHEGRPVSGAVYNLLGQEVRRLVDAHQNRGLHTVTWDGRTHAGRRAAGGLYIVRIEAGDCAAAGKVLLLR